MSKIERFQGDVKAFASNAQGLERTVFGETTQANDLTSQVTAAFLRGWGIVGPSEHPSIEDFNAAMYAMSQFIAYQHQVGVPEWHAAQEYHTGSVCTHGGVSYQSLDDENIGNEPPSAKWTPVLTAKNGGDYFQPKNTNLTALAALVGSANKLPYFTGAGAMANADLTAAGRELISKADVAAILTYLGLGGGPFVSAGGGSYDKTFKLGRVEILPHESNSAALYNTVGSSSDGSIVSGASFQWYQHRFDIGIVRDNAEGTRGLAITHNGNTVALINRYGDVSAVRGLFESGGTVRAYSQNNPPPAPTGFATAFQYTAPVEVEFRDTANYPKTTDGAAIHNLKMVGGASNVGTLVFRYLQVQINGTWVTINN